jgi:hypothetical protein
VRHRDDPFLWQGASAPILRKTADARDGSARKIPRKYRSPKVERGRRVLAAYDKALAEGGGAVTVDGKMIDVPGVERARRLVEREEAIAAHEARMKAMAAQF